VSNGNGRVEEEKENALLRGREMKTKECRWRVKKELGRLGMAS
jgi:hypothetical protein